MVLKDHIKIDLKINSRGKYRLSGIIYFNRCKS